MRRYFLPLTPLEPGLDYTLIEAEPDPAPVRLADIASVAFTRGTRITMADGSQRPVEEPASRPQSQNNARTAAPAAPRTKLSFKEQRELDSLPDRIVELDKDIKEIEALDKKKSELLARKSVIEQLQANRSQMVHLFDELVRTIPDGVRLNNIKQAGDILTLEGVAQSNARVSSYIRALEVSGWITNPDLTVIEAKGTDKTMPFTFALKVKLIKVKSEGDESTDEEAVAMAGGAR